MPPMPRKSRNVGRFARATISRKARSTTSRLVRAPDSFIASATTASSMSMLVIMARLLYMRCTKKPLSPLYQFHPREFALADLEHIAAGVELQALVADHGRIDTHA